MTLGFTSHTTKQESDHSLEKLQLLLRNEVVPLHEFEETILTDLHRIDDLKHNSRVMEDHMTSIQLLARQREQIVSSILRENAKPKVERDINRCREYFQTLHQLDQELSPRIERSFQEITKLRLTEASILYHENKNHNIIREVDTKARSFSSNLMSISKRMQDVQHNLEKINTELL